MWNYFSHHHACSRALALALWNDKDPILKERLFGLINRHADHDEDVKEYYFEQTAFVPRCRENGPASLVGRPPRCLFSYSVVPRAHLAARRAGIVDDDFSS